MLEKLSLDTRRDYIVPGNKEATINFCVKHFISLYKAAIKKKGFFSVALSGGSTPKAIFQKLSSPLYKEKIDWSKVLIFWSDERAVGPDSEESNYKMAMDAGLKDVVFPSKTFRMKAEENIEESALSYEYLIKEKLDEDLFDLVMLGVGDDGHTASLFPDTEALEATDRLIVANYIPSKSAWRMTFTFTCINKSKMACLYVLGKNKQIIVKKVLLDKEKFPSFHVGTSLHKALWILDEDAAALIS